jgi:hypothetical protein
MRIGLDLNGLLDERPGFFAFLAGPTRRRPLRRGAHLPRPGHAGEDGGPVAGVGQRLRRGALRSLSDKGRLCRELEIDIYFDDRD